MRRREARFALPLLLIIRPAEHKRVLALPRRHCSIRGSATASFRSQTSRLVQAARSLSEPSCRFELLPLLIRLVGVFPLRR